MKENLDPINYAKFENNGELTICSRTSLFHFQPPAYQQITVISNGPYKLSTTYHKYIGTVACTDTVPYTEYFLLIFFQKTGQLFKNIQFPNPLTGLSSTPKYIFIATDNFIQLIDNATFQILSTINQIHPFCFSSSSMYVSYPDEAHQGNICISSVPDFTYLHSFHCHSGRLQLVEISSDGNLITSSENGTLIRLFDIKTGNKIGEYRRGFTQEKITCLDSIPSLVCACSSHSAHIFTRSGGHLVIHLPGLPLACKLDSTFITVVTANGLLSYFKFDFVNMTTEMKLQLRLVE